MPFIAWLPEAEPGPFARALDQNLGGEVALVTGEGLEGREAVDALVYGVPSAEHLDACPRLRAVVIPYAGVPERTRMLVAERAGLHLHNVHHNAAPTAEMAITLMLAILKRVRPFDRALRDGDWRPRYEAPESRTLQGLRVLILGMGAIGVRVARTCLAMGMRVEGIRRVPRPCSDLPEVVVHGVEDLHARLAEADVVHVCLPATPETDGVLDAAALACLPEGAALINVGRGRLVDQHALYDLCASGLLAGAGLDVWWNYPRDVAARAETLPADVPFHMLDNVVLSPHRAGLTVETEALRAEHVAHVLRQLARGEEADHRVDLGVGY